MLLDMQLTRKIYELFFLLLLGVGEGEEVEGRDNHMKLTSLACTSCFPISDQVKFRREFSFCFSISYAYRFTCVRQHLRETVP